MRRGGGAARTGVRNASCVRLPGDTGDTMKTVDTTPNTEVKTVVGELAAGLAHEIKNPLAGIKGAVDILLRRPELSDFDREALEGIAGEILRIDSTVSSLLALARPRTLQLKRASLPLVVSRGVNRAIEANFGEGDSPRPEVAIELDLPPEPISLEIDAGQIENAVAHLVANAVEAVGERGRVTVSVRRETEDGRQRAVVEVGDNGHGIEPSDLERIFEPLYTTRAGGTGLGLPAVRRIARAHGGRVEVRSVPGKGATFLLSLDASATRRRPATNGNGSAGLDE